MDSFKFNQIAMAVLGTVFVLFGVSLISESLFHSEVPETPGYAIAAAEASSGESASTGKRVERVCPGHGPCLRAGSPELGTVRGTPP